MGIFGVLAALEVVFGVVSVVAVETVEEALVAAAQEPVADSGSPLVEELLQQLPHPVCLQLLFLH